MRSAEDKVAASAEGPIFHVSDTEITPCLPALSKTVETSVLFFEGIFLPFNL